MSSNRASNKGFTIVELLIVIVVIAILATISVVVYNGIQARANDSNIRAGVSQFEKALRLWLVDNPPPIRGGSGSTVAASNGTCSDGTSGWVASGTYPCAVEDALISAGNLPSGFLRSLPRNTGYPTADGRYVAMLYTCGANRYVLYWTLQSPSAEDIAGMDSALATCGHGTNFRDTYNMRGGRVIQL